MRCGAPLCAAPALHPLLMNPHNALESGSQQMSFFQYISKKPKVKAA